MGKHARPITTHFLNASDMNGSDTFWEHNNDHVLDTLLGTEKGIAHLMEFIEVSNAFAKETVM